MPGVPRRCCPPLAGSPPFPRCHLPSHPPLSLPTPFPPRAPHGRDAKSSASSLPALGSRPTQLADEASKHRAYPDLSLAGSAVQMVHSGKVILVDGTSAAAPLFAAMVSNVIASRRARGPADWRRGEADPLGSISGGDAERAVTAANVTRSYRLGWLNPTLYSNQSAFTDIVNGQNTDGRGVTCPTDQQDYENAYEDANYEQFKENGVWQNVYLQAAAGFRAAAGWDPVSGLGSIEYPRLEALFPLRVATSAGDGCLGCDYYDAQSDEDSAEDWEQTHSVPSPPAYSYG